MTPRDQIGSHFDNNLGRVMKLLALHGVIVNGDSGLPTSHWPDLLRAAVVLLHATLEDLLRSLAEWKLPQAHPDAFDRIAFALDERRKKELTLSELAHFRGRSVDSVINDSVNAHLESATYNDVNSVVKLLRDVQVDVVIPRNQKAKLASMMVRRHLIAHRADRDPPDEQGVRTEREIDPRSVEEWADTVREVGDLILRAT